MNGYKDCHIHGEYRLERIVDVRTGIIYCAHQAVLAAREEH